jgi:hypothetical protein
VKWFAGNLAGPTPILVKVERSAGRQNDPNALVPVKIGQRVEVNAFHPARSYFRSKIAAGSLCARSGRE